jgi:hypothetical protein
VPLRVHEQEGDVVMERYVEIHAAVFVAMLRSDTLGTCSTSPCFLCSPCRDVLTRRSSRKKKEKLVTGP